MIEKKFTNNLESIENGEHIVSAALQVNGEVYSFPRPNRHDDVLWRKSFFKQFKHLPMEQRRLNSGFITSKRRFVDRSEAAEIFSRNNPGYTGKYLITEDIWSSHNLDNTESVVCVAIKINDEVYVSKRPNRHGEDPQFENKLVELQNSGEKPVVTEGFWTTRGRFVNRREAMNIHKANHPNITIQGDELYSEDLWSDWSPDA